MKARDVADFAVRFLFGSIPGAVIGLGIYARFVTRQDASASGWPYIAIGAIIGGLLLAIGKDAIWEG